MSPMTTTTPGVTGGVDTHGQTHHAAVLDHLGRQLEDREFPTTPSGYRSLLAWMAGHGQLERIGVEGTGTYAAALTRRHSCSQGCAALTGRRRRLASWRAGGAYAWSSVLVERAGRQCQAGQSRRPGRGCPR